MNLNNYFFQVPNIYEININDLLNEYHIKGVMADIDNTVVAHNSAEICHDTKLWFYMLREVGIEYCLTTYNVDRQHVYQVQTKLDCEIIFNDPLNPFKSPVKEAARLMKINPSQIAAVNDFYLPLIISRRLGCLCFKVEPIDITSERNDSTTLRIGRFLEKILKIYLEGK